MATIRDDVAAVAAFIQANAEAPGAEAARDAIARIAEDARVIAETIARR